MFYSLLFFVFTVFHFVLKKKNKVILVKLLNVHSTCIHHDIRSTETLVILAVMYIYKNHQHLVTGPYSLLRYFPPLATGWCLAFSYVWCRDYLHCVDLPVSERTCVHPLTPLLYPPTLSDGSASSSPSPSQSACESVGEEEEVRQTAAARDYISTCLRALVGTCCCCCILAVSVVISCALSPAWVSRRRSCFLRSGSESEARSTGRLRSRIWAHNSSFCFCRRPTSDWLSCRHPHRYVVLISKLSAHPPSQTLWVCLLVIGLNSVILLWQVWPHGRRSWGAAADNKQQRFCERMRRKTLLNLNYSCSRPILYKSDLAFNRQLGH